MNGTRRVRGKAMPKGSWILYLMMVPGLAWILCFKLLPITGITIAFKDYNIFLGDGPWVGLKYFEQMFSQSRFLRVVQNTFEIGLLKLVTLFPLPILLALMLNELKRERSRRFFQTVFYLPHFLSFVVIHSVFVTLLSTQGGPVNDALSALGLEKVSFYTNERFRLVLILTEAYRDVGFNTIVYVSALSAMDTQMFEMAEVDGANRLQQAIHLTLPELMPVIMLMLTVRLGSALKADTEQILVMYNPSVYKTADVIGSFVFREGIGGGQFSLSAAIGLFESAVSFALILCSNFITSHFFGRGLLS